LSLQALLRGYSLRKSEVAWEPKVPESGRAHEAAYSKRDWPYKSTPLLKDGWWDPRPDRAEK